MEFVLCSEKSESDLFMLIIIEFYFADMRHILKKKVWKL